MVLEPMIFPQKLFTVVVSNLHVGWERMAKIVGILGTHGFIIYQIGVLYNAPMTGVVR